MSAPRFAAELKDSTLYLSDSYLNGELLTDRPVFQDGSKGTFIF